MENKLNKPKKKISLQEMNIVTIFNKIYKFINPNSNNFQYAQKMTTHNYRNCNYHCLQSQLTTELINKCEQALQNYPNKPTNPQLREYRLLAMLEHVISYLRGNTQSKELVFNGITSILKEYQPNVSTVSTECLE
jgi:hypothetical protein